MQRIPTIEEAKKIMGKNFIGPKELVSVKKTFKVFVPTKNIPSIPFSADLLKKINKNYILVLGLPESKNGKRLSIDRMREIFGCNPKIFEPCFYNQDWYLDENFAKDKTLEFRWYLVGRKVDNNTRGKDVDLIEAKKEDFPSAVLICFVFFAYYLCNKEILWEKDFLWCKEKDSNGDRIYVGRYKDPKKINKNGFNIHRHLSIRRCYGMAPVINEFSKNFK